MHICLHVHVCAYTCQTQTLQAAYRSTGKNFCSRGDPCNRRGIAGWCCELGVGGRDCMKNLCSEAKRMHGSSSSKVGHINKFTQTCFEDAMKFAKCSDHTSTDGSLWLGSKVVWTQTQRQTCEYRTDTDSDSDSTAQNSYTAREAAQNACLKVNQRSDGNVNVNHCTGVSRRCTPDVYMPSVIEKPCSWFAENISRCEHDNSYVGNTRTADQACCASGGGAGLACYCKQRNSRGAHGRRCIFKCNEPVGVDSKTGWVKYKDAVGANCQQKKVAAQVLAR